MKTQILKLKKTVPDKQAFFALLRGKAVKVAALRDLSSARGRGFEFEDLRELIPISEEEMEGFMKGSPNCVEIGSRWYYVDEGSLLELFWELIPKIAENKLDIQKITHQ